MKNIYVFRSKEAGQIAVQRKQAKLRWMQDQSHSNVDNLRNVTHEAGIYFRTKKEELPDI